MDDNTVNTPTVPPTDYVDKTYKVMQVAYGKDFTLDDKTFRSKIQSDPNYANKVYQVMQHQYGDKFTLDTKSFNAKLGNSQQPLQQSPQPGDTFANARNMSFEDPRNPNATPETSFAQFNPNNQQKQAIPQPQSIIPEIQSKIKLGMPIEKSGIDLAKLHEPNYTTIQKVAKDLNLPTTRVAEEAKKAGIDTDKGADLTMGQSIDIKNNLLGESNKQNTDDYFDKNFGSDWDAMKDSYAVKQLESIASSLQQVKNGVMGKDPSTAKNITDIFAGGIGAVFGCIPAAQVFMASQTMAEQGSNAIEALINKDPSYISDENKGSMKKIMDVAMNLPSKALEHFGYLKTTKEGSWQENVGNFYNTVWQLALLSGGGKVIDKIGSEKGVYTSKDLAELSKGFKTLEEVGEKIIKKEPLTKEDFDNVVKTGDEIVSNPDNLQKIINTDPSITPEEKQDFNDRMEFNKQLDAIKPEEKTGSVEAPKIDLTKIGNEGEKIENPEEKKTYFEKNLPNETTYKSDDGNTYSKDAEGKLTVTPTEEVKPEINPLTGQPKPDLPDNVKLTPTIKVGENTYYGKNHGEAMQKAIDTGEKIPSPDSPEGKLWRSENGKFTDQEGKVLTRDEAQDKYGVSASEEIQSKNLAEIPQTGSVGVGGDKKTISIFHGTTAEIAKEIEDNGFDVEKGADGTMWFTSNKSKIESGEVGASVKGGIVERTIDESTLKLGGYDEQDKYSTGELINMGYDGLKLVDDGEITYQIFEPNKLGKKIEQSLKEAPQVKEKVEEPKKEPIFKQFEDIVKNSETADEAYEKVRAIKDVPQEIADEFHNKYNQGGNLSAKEAFNKFYDEVKAGKDTNPETAENLEEPIKKEDKDIEDKFNDAVKEKEEDEKRINETEVHDKYKKLEDTWLGNIDEKNLEAKSEATNFQEEIQKATPKGTKWRDIDKAIHIYLDTKNNPEHYNQHYEKLTPEQKRIADLSQNLTPEQKAIADKISKSYEDVGKLSKEEGIIKETLDNYVARAWDFKGKAATDINKAFTTSTRHSLNRTLETILEGQAKGYNLKVEGATNNLEILRQEINSVIENKRLIDEGSKIPVGEKIEGEPQKKLFMTFPTDGYKKVENPFFKKWDFAGKVSDQDESQLMGQRKDIVVTEDGNIIQKKDVYAPDKVANNLNNILGESKLKGIPAFDWVRHFNFTVKESVLLTSLFHPIAFLRNKFESGAFNKLGDLSPTEAKNQGLQYIKDLTPHIRTLVRNGLTIGKIQDWDELSLQQKGSVSKLMEKWNVTKSISDKVGDLVYNQKHWLFENFGAGLKAFDAVNALKNEIIKNPGKDINEIAKAVANTCNNNYGGLNLKRIGRNPTTQDIFHLVCMAPDWTESNLRMAVAAFKGGYEGEFARKMWTKVAMRGTTALALTNIAMAFMPDPNDKSKDPVQNAVDRFKRAWDEGNLDWAKMNISPLAHAMGAPTNKDYYFSVFGHYTDPIRLISGTADPLIALAPGKLAKSFGGSTSSLKFFLNKGSIVTKMAGQALTAQDWKGQEYTTIDELLGIDDKGKYTKTQKEHKKGDISPTTGKPYVSDKAGFESGTEKGGKLEGKLVKSSIDKAHPVEIPQIPSWGIEQIRGSIPIPLANLWQYLEGENDGFTTIANSVGLGITKVGQPKDKKAETPITPPTDKVSKDKESTDKKSEDKVSPDKGDDDKSSDDTKGHSILKEGEDE